MNCAAAFEVTQRLDMESFARYDEQAFRRVHHPEAITALYTWRGMHRFVDACRSAFAAAGWPSPTRDRSSTRAGPARRYGPRPDWSENDET